MTSHEAERVLKLLADSLEEGKEFVLEQAPDIAREIVTRGLVVHGITAVFCIIGMIYSIRLIERFYQWSVESNDGKLGADFQLFIKCLHGISFLWAICAFNSVIGLATIYVCPKLYILEEASRIVR